MSNEIGFVVNIDESFDETVVRVTDALKSEGFGVLTKIDVKATLKDKLDQDFRPYVIMGACNPPLAHRALDANAEVGLMLPCNVTVEEQQDGESLVRIANPKMMMNAGKLGDNMELREVAQEAYFKLERVAQKLLQG